ncbi:MAG TPA: hypothetical protein PKE37_15555 [Thiomonas arsenitoxydans]|uniref:hypothetical protein n=1 Tax=Thiomonas arsenitoxydans (strain DSM 22701 / CIP 110005 / 3As) TaxID=426114 RepID=UPI002CAE0545|nr:hypothetical protein [Thiomonas arsenitoxydans]HML83171.1 hypothetical protein [Thiomonas arsenitoxydans]
MRSALPRALIALSLLAGCATTPTASEPRIRLQRPSECLTACPQLPTPTERDELAVTLWTLDLIDAAAECRRMHETCRNAAQ